VSHQVNPLTGLQQKDRFLASIDSAKVAMGFELGNYAGGIELRRIRFLGLFFNTLFEPREYILLLGRKPQSVNKKRLFTKYGRRAVDNLSRGNWI
jgi:hypothetical protein